MDISAFSVTPRDIEVRPLVYIAVVAPSDDFQPDAVEWAIFKPYVKFNDLTVGQSEDSKPIIWLVPDTDENLAVIRLLCEHSTVVGLDFVWVRGLNDHQVSLLVDQSFYGAEVIDFKEWQAEQDETARQALLLKRAAMDSDEKKSLDSQRKDGSYRDQTPESLKPPADTGLDDSPPEEDITQGFSF